MTHAFFKGLLFLGAGSVIHGMHEEQDIRNMGGLRKYMPVTFWTFLIASFANAGVIPFAGFWSKDEIIVGGWISDHQPIGQIVAVVGLAAAFLTALYMFRLVFLTFFTAPRFDADQVHPHESPKSMATPLVLLAIPALLIGFVGFPPEDGPLHHFLEPVFGAEGIEHHVSLAMTITFGAISTVVALLGILVAYLTYITGTISATALANRFRGLYEFLYDKWRFDELYNVLFVRPFEGMATFFWRVVDVGIIDATVNGIATGIGATSQKLRHVQTGLLSNYALAIAVGMVLLVGIFLTGFSDLFR
jgi:NADH-quinone oxidoreductase subunit L